MNMEAEIGVMQLQAKQHLEPPDAGRGKERFYPRFSLAKGAWPCQHPDFRLLASRTLRE